MNQNIVDGLALLGMLVFALVYSWLARKRFNHESNFDDFLPDDQHERRVCMARSYVHKLTYEHEIVGICAFGGRGDPYSRWKRIIVLIMTLSVITINSVLLSGEFSSCIARCDKTKEGVCLAYNNWCLNSRLCAACMPAPEPASSCDQRIRDIQASFYILRFLVNQGATFLMIAVFGASCLRTRPANAQAGKLLCGFGLAGAFGGAYFLTLIIADMICFSWFEKFDIWWWMACALFFLAVSSPLKTLIAYKVWLDNYVYCKPDFDQHQQLQLLTDEQKEETREQRRLRKAEEDAALKKQAESAYIAANKDRLGPDPLSAKILRFW